MGAMAERRWARITDSVADILRRGAWYPILEETVDGQVVVDVREGLQVRLKLEDVTVRDEPPSRWSVVVRTGVLRPPQEGPFQPRAAEHRGLQVRLRERRPLQPRSRTPRSSRSPARCAAARCRAPGSASP